LELDSVFLKERGYQEYLTSWGIEIDDEQQDDLESFMSQVASHVVPCELVSPPIPFSRMSEIEALCVALREMGAKGTDESIAYAFGVHFNPEYVSGSVEEMLSVLRSYMLLDSWIRKAFSVDWSRRLSPYIQSYSDECRQTLLDEEYNPSLEELIVDVLSFHPTRNMGLDMTPLFAHTHPAIVNDLVAEKELVSARPTYHFRLPNCRIGDETWSLAEEWQSWRMIECLAADEERLRRLCRAVLAQDSTPFYGLVAETTDPVEQALLDAGWIGENGEIFPSG
jgi:hypothetical protein